MSKMENKIKLGRWIWCKYCQAGLFGKNVKPELGGVYQVICSECGSGLTPDFFSEEGLMEYLKSGDYDKASNVKEEKTARRIGIKMLKKGVVRPSTYNPEPLLMIDMHTSQPELRKAIKNGIKTNTNR